MSSITDQRVGAGSLAVRCLLFASLLAIAAVSVRIAIVRFSGSGASVAVALVASFVAVAALNTMFVMIERWLEIARESRAPAPEPQRQ